MTAGFALDAVFAEFGVAASYTPAGGAAVALRVLPRRPDTVVHIFEASIQSLTALFEIRASELDAAAEGDRLDLDGTGYRVQSAQRFDPDRLIWTLSCVPADGA